MAKPKTTEEVAQYDWENYAGNTGLEGLSQQDLGIPMLCIIQKGSAEFDTEHPDHEIKKIEGVKVGDIINTSSREILYTTGGNPVKVVPYFYKLVYLEWKPKAQGGGIVQVHTNPNILSQTRRDPQSNKDVLPNGNNIVTTAYYFVRVLIEGRDTFDALIAFTSTQLKKSRVWLNMMKGFTGPTGNTLPMFHRPYFLSTVGESNAKGTWRGWKLEAGPNPLVDKELIEKLLATVKEAQENSSLLIGNSAPHDEDIV